MTSRVLPRGLKYALELLRRDLGREWTVNDLAGASGLSRRALQSQFRGFLGATPVEFLRLMRLARARSQLLSAEPAATVTTVAAACGLTHLGRFASWYRKRYGESPSATLNRARSHAASASRWQPLFTPRFERPSIAVLPFALLGHESARIVALQDEIANALCASRWFSVTDPAQARYQLRGNVRDEGGGQLHVAVILWDKSTQKYLFAECWDGPGGELFGFEDRLAKRLTSALLPTVRDAEITRAWQHDPAQSTAWDLSMRAMRELLLAEPLAEERTLESLEQAMELAPRDPLPMALAAWCHSVRASHHQTSRPDDERRTARRIAARAELLADRDATIDAMLAAAYTLAHDLDTATTRADQALRHDAGSSWAWGRSAWIEAYRGNPSRAIERFQFALALGPRDPLRYQWSMGIASAHFEAARYREAVRWSRRALFEQPRATTIHRLLAPACVFAGEKAGARQSLGELRRRLPGLTISQVITALPLTRDHLGRRAEGLESVGLRPD
jgi:AraC-like DNA-binding protein/tetratricopeptide (TPR) repeat protein